MSSGPSSRIARHTPQFRRTTLALFSAGFSTFALMYCVQPLLPAFVREFNLSPAQSSLAVSLTTASLASALLVVGALAEGVGRKRVMVTSLALGAILTALCAGTSNWPMLLVLRAAVGLVFAGLPAIAMAYVGEELEPGAVGLAMGIYVGGTAVGGMAGRVFTALVADATSWRTAVVAIGGLGSIAALLVWLALPASRHFERRSIAPAALLGTYRGQLGDRVLTLLYAQGFLYMGVFIAVYNYIGFRLLAPPFNLSATRAGTVFLLYAVGMVSSPWAGQMALHRGRGRTLTLSLATMFAGVVLTLFDSLLAIAAGVASLTFGFFAAHSVTSSWVGHRARTARAQASSLYLCLYYLGASVIGAAAGLFWQRDGWTWVAAFLLTLVAVALLLAQWLGRISRAAA